MPYAISSSTPTVLMNLFQNNMSLTNVLHLFLLALAGFASACEQGANSEKISAVTNDEVASKISQVNHAIQECIKANDAACVLKYYHDDVRFMPDGQATVIGKKNVEPFLGWVKDERKLKWRSDETGVMDPKANFVFERTREKIYLKEDTLVLDGKGVIIWKKTDDGYKIYVQIYNYNTQSQQTQKPSGDGEGE
ncbi:uncharacterized protein LOC110981138 [Acanthaster planci]|uniref:Uncharacterized protein LOC110981138 n=1 Tax=Acanthaster planci TaxID=133434 RepID=A0A8B7YN82_ACAPL|nr:uncharacterized protein LOC110981138 [Acanthaster planci]